MGLRLTRGLRRGLNITNADSCWSRASLSTETWLKLMRKRVRKVVRVTILLVSLSTRSSRRSSLKSLLLFGLATLKCWRRRETMRWANRFGTATISKRRRSRSSRRRRRSSLWRTRLELTRLKRLRKASLHLTLKRATARPRCLRSWARVLLLLKNRGS